MQRMPESETKVKASVYLNADFAMEYTGRNLLALGLMSGDLVCIKAANWVSSKNIAVVRDQEENLLCRLTWLQDEVVLSPLDAGYPSRIYKGENLPCIVGVVTGWIHSAPFMEDAANE